MPYRYVCGRHAPFYDAVKDDIQANTKFAAASNGRTTDALCLEEGCHRTRQRRSDYCAEHDPATVW